MKKIILISIACLCLTNCAAMNQYWLNEIGRPTKEQAKAWDDRKEELIAMCGKFNLLESEELELRRFLERLDDTERYDDSTLNDHRNIEKVYKRANSMADTYVSELMKNNPTKKEVEQIKKDAPKYYKAVKNGYVMIGMQEKYIIMSLGSPGKINRTCNVGGCTKQYVYGLGSYVYTRGGRVTSWDDAI